LAKYGTFFDQQLDYPITVLDATTVARVNLSNYDVIIMPSGSYNDILSSDDFTAWLRAGGRLIAMEGVVSQLVGKPGFDAIVRKTVEDEESQ
jgi:hypothetical protein